MSSCRFSSEIWHLDLACARAFWGAVIPATFVFLLCLFRVAIPIPTWISNLIHPIKAQLTPFLTLQEAEALDAAAAAETKATLGEGGQDESEAVTRQVGSGHLWKSLLLSWFALLETLVWLGIASYGVIQDGRVPVFIASPFVIALIWLFATVRPIVRPQPTPPYDLFTLYLIFTTLELISICAFAYNYSAHGIPLPSRLILAAHTLNLCALFILITTVLSMPLAIPGSRVKKAKIVGH